MRSFFLFISILFSLSLNAQSDSLSNFVKPYDIKSGRIYYRFFNGIQQGEKTLVFDDYGLYEKMVSRTILTNGVNEDGQFTGDTLREMIIKKNQSIYKISLNDRTGAKTNRSETLPINLDALRPGQVMIGPDTVSGKPCVIIESFAAVRTWYWNRIPIKKQMIGRSAALKVEETAIKIDENYVPSKNEFEVPDGIKIK